MKTLPLHPKRRSWAYTALLALTGCALLSPSSTPTASTGGVTASEGSKVTSITFQWVADKASWAATPLILLGWISATLKARKRQEAIDTCIMGMEAENCDVCQRYVQASRNPIINQRVAIVKAKLKNGNAAKGKRCSR